MNKAMRRKKSGQGGPREGAGRHLVGRIYKTSAQEGLRGAWTRATFIVRKEYVRKLKALALSRGERLKEVLDDILKVALVTPSGEKKSGVKKMGNDYKDPK